MSEFRELLYNYELTTAEIIYRLPDYPELLQTFLWQDYDKVPDFPRLIKFLEFWAKSLDGKLYSVRVEAAGHLVVPTFKNCAFLEKLH